MDAAPDSVFGKVSGQIEIGFEMVDDRFNRHPALRFDIGLKQLIDILRTDALAKMGQLATVARQLATDFGEAAKGLVARIAFELQNDGLIAEVFQLLQNQQAHHETNRLGGTLQALAVMLGKRLIELTLANRNKEALGSSC